MLREPVIVYRPESLKSSNFSEHLSPNRLVKSFVVYIYTYREPTESASFINESFTSLFLLTTDTSHLHKNSNLLTLSGLQVVP